MASLFSLPSPYIDTQASLRFLAAVEALAPERELLVLTDLPARDVLAPSVGERTRLLETHGRPYTPWPRDPLFFARDSGGGGVVLVERPNLQPDREEDSFMGRELIQQLPDALDRDWGGTTWTTSPIPFHNGHILLDEDAVWVSVHSLEVPTLKYLGLDRVPLASFANETGIGRYLDAVRSAARDVGALFQREVRFVHPLPTTGGLASRRDELLRLAGGGGFDLDSLVTLLPGPAGGPAVAMVADLRIGTELLADMSTADAGILIDAYELDGTTEHLLSTIGEYSRGPLGQGLDEFLAIIASHLAEQGVTVVRLPLLLVPTSLRVDDRALAHPNFLITWNNVVVETTADTRRAEGFASLLDPGDRHARDAFARAGYDLALLPPLIESIVRNGGYRCASNHLRAR